MRVVPLLFIGAACLGAGAAVGLVAGSGDGADPTVTTEILVVGEDGEEQAYSVETAAARIEELESVLRRSRGRAERRYDDEAEDDDELISAEDLRPIPPLLRPDGKPYSPAELTVLARGSDDPELRAAAIRALRRVDSADARGTLAAILNDPATPQDLRVLSARMLAQWPHRDHLPDELVTMLGEETDPEVRLELARGVRRLRQRGAWMREISGLLAEESDPEVRGELFSAVSRASRDPAARAELLDIATVSGGSAEERRLALQALNRGRPDKDTIATLAPLLEDVDPAIRRETISIMASSRSMSLETLRTGLDDKDPSVRIAALNRGLRHIGRMGKDKSTDKEQWGATVARAVDLATADSDPNVRRAAMSASYSLPKKTRNQVLAKGREDANLAVRLTAYARSPDDVARKATDDFVGALSSPDIGLRDFAYRQLQRLHDVRVPYSANWNDEARSEAVTEIRGAIR